MHPSITFTKHGKMPKTDRMAGFSRMNVMIMDGLTDDNKDATMDDEMYSYDKCLMRSEARNGILHTNTISPCAAPGSTVKSSSVKPGNC